MAKEQTDLQKFFIKHISIIKSKKERCKECGCSLIGDFSEVAHILPKSRFKSVAMHDDNVIYLCSWKSTNNCHARFDNCSNVDLRKMKIFPHVSSIFENLTKVITEKLSYKDYDRWDSVEDKDN